MWSRSTCTELRRVALGCLAGALLAGSAGAQTRDSLEKLVMPGEVIEGHAKVEAECNRCHQPFRRSEQRALCLDCHKSVAADIDGSEGFHGRSQAKTAECNHCHTEHKGRLADIVQLDRDTFDHSQTDFALEGGHRAPACANCHRSGTLYRDAPHECVACHEKDDAHRGQLGRECAKCHDALGWKRAARAFDHDKTDFPLVGEHAKARCASCHPAQAYEDTPTDCASCHKLRDAHAGRLGPRCEACHEPRGWKSIRFRHDRDTEFPLLGSHARVACEACHQSDPHATKLRVDCVACHREDDAHKGRFGAQCDSCHGPERWSNVMFEHQKTDFPLEGAHVSVSCASCHTSSIGSGKRLDTTCVACHRAGDVHRGELGANCEQCHSPVGWRAEVRFDHGLGRFPLLGLHSVVPCAECHASGRFRDTPMDCAECHADDFHGGTLGPRCELCHNPNGWKLWRFDHAKQTDFPLEGAHADRACRDCHDRPVQKTPERSTACSACHARDDAHEGRYGPDCARCHVPTRWKDVKAVR